MKAVIMAGGPGSRLRPVTAHPSKCLAAIGNLAIPDADRPCVHVAAESTNGERVRVLVEECRDRMTDQKKEAA